MNESDQNNGDDFLSGLDFSPGWAKQSADSHYEKLGKYAERFADRGDGDGRPGRDDRRGFRRDRPPRRDGDRPFRDRPPREGGDRPPFRGDRPFRDRPPREGGERPPFRGDRPFRDRPPREDGERPPFRRDRPFRGERPFREPAPFEIRFLPEHKALGLIAKKVQQSRRAMPLRELVALFFKNPASVLVRAEFDEAHKESRFHQCTACGWFARSPEELLAHQLSAHFADRFEERVIDVEPPKGKYATVARCGVTGRLLGPPNDHGYARSVLEAMRDPACAGLSEAEYRARIELVSDPALVEEWRATQSKKTVYVEKTREEASAPAAETHAESAEAPAPAGEIHAESAEAPAPAEEIHAESAEAPAPAEETHAESAENAEAPASPSAFYDREAAEAVFHAEVAPKMTRVSRAVSAPHAVVDALSDRYVQGEIRRAWEREKKSHVPSLFFAVRGGLKGCRLSLFRASDPARTDFVAPRAPTPLDASTAVPALRAVLDFVAAHPGCTRSAMMAALVPEGTDDAAKAETLKQFAFAVDRGHLIAYANGTLALPEAHPFFHAGDAEAPAPAEETHAESAETPAPTEETHAESAEAPAPTEEAHAEAAEAPAPTEETHAESAEALAPAEGTPAEAAESPDGRAPSRPDEAP